MQMGLALGGAGGARDGARFEDRPHDIAIFADAAIGDGSRSHAHFGAVETEPDKLSGEQTVGKARIREAV